MLHIANGLLLMYLIPSALKIKQQLNLGRGRPHQLLKRRIIAPLPCQNLAFSVHVTDHRKCETLSVSNKHMLKFAGSLR